MYVHCNNCHHEWECTSEDERECDWCGGESYILEDKTPLEKMTENVDNIMVRLKKLNNPLADRIFKKITEHPKKK